MATPTKLRPKQEKFVKAYVAEGNATEAIVQAGYKVKNRAVARAMGAESLARPSVQAAITDWRHFLEAEAVPSLQTIRELRDTCEDPRIRLAASRDLANRAGVGKQIEKQTNVVAVFANMDEGKLLERIARLSSGEKANVSQEEVSPNMHCATHEDGVVGSGDASAK